MIRFTVVTVCYNAASSIRRAVESVADQRVGDGLEIEHIVIDGASSDGTPDIVRQCRHAGLFRLVSERDRGMYDALNKGIDLATGDFVGLLNADDVFDGDDALLRMAAAADGAEALCADIRFVRPARNASGEPSGERTVRYYSARHWRPWMARWGFMVPHPGVYIRRELFAVYGPYKLGYDIAADFELMTRYFVRGRNGRRVKVRYVDTCLVRMSPGGKSTAGWRAYLHANRENVRALRENGIWSCLLMMVPKYAYKVLGLFHK